MNAKIKKGSFLEKLTVASDNPIAAIVGAIIGGAVPCMVAWLAHFQAPSDKVLWAVVVAGLIFSAWKVYQLAAELFGGQVAVLRGFSPSAFGFVALLEATMTLGHGYLPLAPLVILVAFNGLAVAHAMIVGRADTSAKARTAKGVKKPVDVKPVTVAKPKKAKAEKVEEYAPQGWAVAEAQ